MGAGVGCKATVEDTLAMSSQTTGISVDLVGASLASWASWRGQSSDSAWSHSFWLVWWGSGTLSSSLFLKTMLLLVDRGN